jgi:hypothetical protein
MEIRYTSAVRFVVLLAFACFFSHKTNGQGIDPALLQKPWKAKWITGPGEPTSIYAAHADPAFKEYGVFKFRKNISLAEKPSSFVVHVSGDNRYKLFVNGKLVSQGPARGDLYYWNFETVDLAPYLQAGRNSVAALVWNDGRLKPEAQISYLTAFILQGNGPAEEVLNTDESWTCQRDSSYRPLPVRVPGYYVAGPAELVDMNRHIKGWESAGFNDSQWPPARSLAPGLTRGASIDARGWMLVPSPIPQMEMTVQRLAALRKADGVSVPASFPITKTAVTIPAQSNVTLLLDQGFLTNAYPTIQFSRGKSAGISMGYAEALYIRKDENINGSWIPTMPKGNRDEVDGKTFIGKRDSVIADGSLSQSYTPLWWRTYRYIQLRIKTADEPLVLEDIYGTFTGYPFQFNARLNAPGQDFQKMLDIGWRTARLCAFETYMDCPYYEQLQYIGDARIQALVSLYNSGDDRLVRHALDLMDRSRIAEGITLSRYPTDLHQQIPTFSLWWIGMLHDYWMYRPDSAFIQEKLPGERQVMAFFKRYQQADGSLKNVPYWIFTDWVNNQKGWGRGMAPTGSKGESAVMDLQLLWTYQLAAEMEDQMGLKELARQYRNAASLLQKTVLKKYWDNGRQLFADTEAKDLFSQHANALAILSGVVKGPAATALAKKMVTDQTLAPASIYFKYYLHLAGVKAGLGNDYLSWLDIWRENIAMGLTTWAETSDVSRTRSDCHAWGSSPNIELFRTVLGIDSDGPGFRKIKIEPHLGDLKNIGGEMPHPAGKISVQYTVNDAATLAEVVLPAKTSGRLVWKGKSFPLKEGKNQLRM